MKLLKKDKRGGRVIVWAWPNAVLPPFGDMPVSARRVSKYEGWVMEITDKYLVLKIPGSSGVVFTWCQILRMERDIGEKIHFETAEEKYWKEHPNNSGVSWR